MSRINISKRKGPADHPYIAGFDGKPMVELYAPSLAAAKQTAVEHFKPSKKKQHLVWVELAKD